MTSLRTGALLAALLTTIAGTACSRATGSAAHSHAPQPAPAAPAVSESQLDAIAEARADSARHPYTEADIHFMSGMIGHHAQAIVMSSWAPTHGASPAVQTLAARITNAQRDEIRTMQRWLRDRRQPVPEVSPNGMMTHGMMMHGAGHTMLMPGMLTEAQMKELDAARGKEFDRLFLTFMIQHHSGAVSMVKQLLSSYGAAQDELVFKLATDINVDQTTEIARMRKMLAAILFETPAS
jgi:uncharacterized protein (DUF305 family)